MHPGANVAHGYGTDIKQKQHSDNDFVCLYYYYMSCAAVLGLCENIDAVQLCSYL